ncbi:MAG: DUF362 domain-containing protein [Asgard group archaeon]|nr:DUF362 domain-containing protein [Asgard group archaeon]
MSKHESILTEIDHDSTKIKHNYVNKKRFRNSILIFLFINLFWLLFRTGTKPSRIVYPCQRAATQNIAIALSSLIPFLSFTVFSTKKQEWLATIKTFLLVFLIISPFCGGLILQKTRSSTNVGLEINPYISSSEFTSDIFVVNGPKIAHINDLLELMGSHDLKFYRSLTDGLIQGPNGLIASNDIILIKNNCQWEQRGGTNTDVLKELIQTIVDHPDGFTGEIVIADNGQGRGRMNWGQANAINRSQSIQTVANFFSQNYKVSTFLFDTIRFVKVNEYSDGNMDDGYIVYDSADPESGVFVSYPKFNTTYGTLISFKNGIWNGTNYEQRLKIINVPVLKSHSNYGVTASMKHYMGVQTQGLANGHDTIATGSMGTLMAELGLPTLNIIDAIWINANPAPSLGNGPSTSYGEATNVSVLMAGLDPIALDYWAAKHILLQAANLLGESGIHTLDPDNTERSGLTEAFGVWLERSKDELIQAGYNVTSNEEEMNVYANTLDLIIGPSETSRLWLWVGLSSSCGVALITGIIFSIRFIIKKRKK